MPYQPYPITPSYTSYQPYQQQTPAVPQAPAVQQHIQSFGFTPVHGEDEARNYPVAPGNSVTLKDESSPFIYVKTMGFSPFDKPIFEKFRLVKEEATAIAAPAFPAQAGNENGVHTPQFDQNDAIRKILGLVEGLSARFDNAATEKKAEGEDNV